MGTSLTALRERNAAELAELNRLMDLAAEEERKGNRAKQLGLYDEAIVHYQKSSGTLLFKALCCSYRLPLLSRKEVEALREQILKKSTRVSRMLKLLRDRQPAGGVVPTQLPPNININHNGGGGGGGGGGGNGGDGSIQMVYMYNFYGNGDEI
ncbi:uncharacterized protein A4U43_C09F4520 [Asparagus officinalis]|uniref:Uncharacterized protein n=1 Tax=Asparagus officinalis TaxID=4686 RepID=A0A5P1E5A7_ASPOF|nr:uncharacterized protein LOC109824350 [Asparagus officinalis]ONK57824.1 uncharacterized protein A4U43_C09F4520 [Asparagus officinalis]